MAATSSSSDPSIEVVSPPAPEYSVNKPENSSKPGGARPYVRSKTANRFRWSEDLHRRFLQAVEMLGGVHHATPKGVLELMDAKELTLAHVRSHLQMLRSNKHEQITHQAMMEEPQHGVQQNAVVSHSGVSAPVYRQPHGCRHLNHPPSPPPTRYYIDPVGPMPPSLPPCMRRMDFSTPEPEPTTIMFGDLFTRCNDKLKNKIVEEDVSTNNAAEERGSPMPSLTTIAAEINDEVSLDLTLGLLAKP